MVCSVICLKSTFVYFVYEVLQLLQGVLRPVIETGICVSDPVTSSQHLARTLFNLFAYLILFKVMCAQVREGLHSAKHCCSVIVAGRKYIYPILQNF